jgi:hypothetical protein
MERGLFKRSVALKAPQPAEPVLKQWILRLTA